MMRLLVLLVEGIGIRVVQYRQDVQNEPQKGSIRRVSFCWQLS
jgi:hypothetical protein